MTTTNTLNTRERQHGEAVLDIQYGIQFNDLNARFYRRLNSIFSIINVVGGSITFATAIAGAPIWAGTAGVIIAVCAYIEREVRPAEKSVYCELHRRKFGKLAAKAHDLTLAEIDQRLRILQSTGPQTIASLEKPAYNRNVTTHGYPEYCLQLSLWERVAYWLA